MLRRVFPAFDIGRMFIRRYQSTSSSNVTELFYREEVQGLLHKLTRPDPNKVFRARKDGVLEVPKYEFMTTADLEKAREEAAYRMKEKLQMPPVMEARADIDEVISLDPNLKGYIDTKFIFTDITYGSNDRDRTIVVRDVDGTLRQASLEERARCNEIYFPRPGRRIEVPSMFQDENLLRLMEEGEYEFILDTSCCQFEPDDALYISTCEKVYNHIDQESSYNSLRSTRHYGPLVFYLARNNRIDNLLLENIVTDNLEEAVWLISLYNEVNAQSKCKNIKYDPSNPLDYIKAYIEAEGKSGSKLDRALTTYRDVLSVSPPEESV